MKAAGYHHLLAQQLQQALGDDAKLPPRLAGLLRQVSQTYDQLETMVKLRTEQLMASSSQAYSFLDSLHMGLIICDLTPEVVLTNHSLRQMLPGDAATTWTLAAIVQQLPAELKVAGAIGRCLKTRRPHEFRTARVGQRTLRLFVAPMVNEAAGQPQAIGVVILVEDITEQTLLERSKDEFFFIASHELRTPLTAIRGNARLIRKYYANNMQDPEVGEMVDSIHASAIRLIEIVNDFLDVSAMEQGKIQMHPEAFRLQDVIDEVVQELQGVCSAKGIALVRDVSVAAAPAVKADKQRIKQVVYNLVGNAIKFTDKGGVTIRTRAEDAMVYCGVSDTGAGMSQESQRLLFRKFQQAGNSLLTRDGTKGTGLGLYISKLIMERSGGSIELERSAVGQGSTFAFRLPAAPER